jgi:hypothetical protein
MPADAFLWKPQEEPDRIASYLSKTRKDGGQKVKAAFSWLTFMPAWEVGFRRHFTAERSLCLPIEFPRKKKVDSPLVLSLEKESHPVSPRYTVEAPEKQSDAKRHECPVCWHRWGRSLWEGLCKCNSAFPSCRLIHQCFKIRRHHRASTRSFSMSEASGAYAVLPSCQYKAFPAMCPESHMASKSRNR